MVEVFLNSLGVIGAPGDQVSRFRPVLFQEKPNTLTCSDEFSPGKPVALGQIKTPWSTFSSKVDSRFRSRTNQLMWTALSQILPDIEHVISLHGRSRVGLVVGTSAAGLGEGLGAAGQLNAAQPWPAGYHHSMQEMGSPAQFGQQALNLSGPCYSISTACSSGAKALAAGVRLLQSGLVDAVIAGGVDVLAELTVRGFMSLESVSAIRCNPLSGNRSGINLGEGAAFFIMSRKPGPVRLSGYGESSDAYHMSAPEPTGRGAIASMTKALQLASIQPNDVDYINLHGTATAQNDAMEALAIQTVFGANMAVSSTKPLTGHTLAAAGALEAAICWMALTENPDGRLPVHHWDGEPDPKLASVRPVVYGDFLGRPLRHLLSNSFAFGGNNISLILSQG